jgi:hypothetical protein
VETSVVDSSRLAGLVLSVVDGFVFVRGDVVEGVTDGADGA